MNDALPALIAGIAGYGLAVWGVGMFFVKDKLSYSIGVWYGIAIAIGVAVHIASVLWDAVSLGDDRTASRKLAMKSVLRYVVVAIMFLMLGYFKFGNIFAAFLGMLGLKISAYLQPVITKMICRVKKGRTKPEF